MTETERVERTLHRIINQTENKKARAHVQAALTKLYRGETDVDRFLVVDEFRFSDGDIHPTEGDFGIYWAIPAMVHLLMRFGESLSDAARETVVRVLRSFYYIDGHNVVKRDASPSRMYLSENHDSLLKVSLYLLAKFCGQYLDKPLDGMDTEEVVEALTAYFHNILDVMLKNGWMIEGGDPYNAVTLESYYNLMELSGDKALSQKVKKWIDVFWCFHAAESLNNVRGYARTRLYPYWEDNNENWISSLFEVYTGQPAIREGGMMDYLILFGYRPPKAVFDILGARKNAEPYTVQTKVRGGGYYVLEELRENEPLPLSTPIYYLDLYSQILRTTYVTQHYTVSGFSFPLTVPLSLIAAQCRWEGATFAEPQGSAVYAGTREEIPALFDTFVTLHHKNTILYAPNKNAYWHDTRTNPVTIVHRGEAAYRFRMELKMKTKGEKADYEITDGNILTGRFGNNYFGFITNDGFTVEEDRVVVNSQLGVLKVSHADETDYESFCADIGQMKVSFTEEKIACISDGEQLELFYRDDSDHIRLINGNPLEYLTQDYVKSPFINSKIGSGEFQISSREEEQTWL